MKTFIVENRPVELIRVDRNDDRSKFVVEANFLDGEFELLNDQQLDELQAEYGDAEELNGMWG